MLSHQAVWRGIDMLAAENQLSASGLAKRAGLDPTTFNKSKRMTKQGKPRWPSTESLAKILEATRTSMAHFVGLLDERAPAGEGLTAAKRLRSLRLTHAEEDLGTFDEAGFPNTGAEWEDIELGTLFDDDTYALEIDRDLAPPLLRSGDLVIVAPHSSVRRADRVVLRRRSGGLEFGVFQRRTAQRLSLAAFSGEEHRLVEIGDVLWQARIVAICSNH